MNASPATPPTASADWLGRRVWVTGATSGIGRAVTAELLARGATVIATGRDRAALGELRTLAGPGRLVRLRADVTNRRALMRGGGRIARRLGAVDVAFFNAGTCEYIDARRFESAPFERLMRVNFLGVVHGVEAALPLLRGGRRPLLALMGSAAAIGGLPRAEAYGATKAAVAYLAASLRLSLRGEGVAVTLVEPGFVRTPLTDRNDFAMPLRVEADRAARIIVAGLARRRPRIAFPRAFTLPFRLLALLPDRLYAAILSKWVLAS